MNDRLARIYNLFKLREHFEKLYRGCINELCEMHRDGNCCYDFQKMLLLYELIDMYDQKMRDVKHQLEYLVETY